MRTYTFLICFFILIVTSSTSHATDIGPRLPEPMIFDLLLPLGTKKNTTEINSLFQYNFSEDAAEYNPELEYSYMDGYAIELEFPMRNTTLEAYKLALQGTFSFLQTKNFIHGWQYIAEYHKHSKAFENDLLYLFGYQFNEEWSMLNMIGFRLTDARARGHLEGLVNGNLFYKYSKELTMGLEVNWTSRPNRPDETLLMPQLHIQLATSSTLQIGFGMKRAHNKNSAHSASRIIFVF